MSSGGEEGRSSGLISTFQSEGINNSTDDSGNGGRIPIGKSNGPGISMSDEGILVGSDELPGIVNVQFCTLVKGVSADDQRVLEPTHIETNEGGKLKRNSFACISCHSLKQKCVPSDIHDIYRKPCIRCLKNNKLCKFDLSRRTRKRKRRESPFSSPSSASPKPEFRDSHELKKEHLPTSPLTKPLGSNSNSHSSCIHHHYHHPGVPTFFQDSSQNNPHPIANIWSRQSSAAVPMGASTNFDPASTTAASMAVPSTSNGYPSGIPNNFPIMYNPNETPAMVIPNLLRPQHMEAMPENTAPTIPLQHPTTSANVNILQSSSTVGTSNNADIASTTIHSDLGDPSNIGSGNPNVGNNNSNHNDTGDRSIDNDDSVVGSDLTPRDFNQRKKALKEKHVSRGKNRNSFKKQLHELLAYQKRKLGEIASTLNCLTKEWNKMIQHSFSITSVTDPISLGLIFQDEAELRFELFMKNVLSKVNTPFVSIPPGTTVDQIRHEKPILFSTIMSCSSIMMTQDNTSRETNMKLDSFLLALMTDQIFKDNNKSIELIESLLTLCFWYNFPEWAHKARYHIFNYVCVCLTRELGPTVISRTFGMCIEEDPSAQQRSLRTPLEESDNGPRLILLVYICSLNISIFLRQSIKACWAPATEQACLEVSKKISFEGDSIVEGDKTLVVFARLNHILERIHVDLHEHGELDSDYNDGSEFTQKYVDYLIKKFQNNLNKLYKEIPSNRRRVLAYFYSVEAYLYQYIIASYIESMPTKYGIGPLPAKISDAFLKCYEYCALTLKEFVKLTPKLVSALPSFHSTRIIYTVGMLLLKLRYSAIALPAFQQFQPFTDDALILVTEVSKLLEDTSKIYIFNHFLYKLQYVVALFVQSYTNKVRAFKNSHEKEDNKRSTISNEIDFFESLPPVQSEVTAKQAANLPQPSDNIILSTPYPTTNTNTATSATDKNLPAQTNNSHDLENTMKFPTTSPYDEFGSNSANVQPPSAASTENLSDFLADTDSIVWGFNALNDEFWTDIFLNDL